MKGIFKTSIFVLLTIMLCSCGTTENKVENNKLENKSSIKTSINELDNETTLPKVELANPDAKYVGDYENDEIYSKILEIESCTTPNKLVAILKDIYGFNFVYTKLKYDSKDKIYNFPNNSELPVFCTVLGAYKIRKDVFAKPDVYFVYQEFGDGEGKIISEEPTFIIDKYGSYLVDKYEYFTGESTGEEMLNVEARPILDLYMCERGFINNDEMKAPLSKYVNELDFFKEFESLIDDNLNNDGINNENIEDESTEQSEGSEYGSSDAENDSDYEETKIKEISIIQKIDSCTDPDELCDILSNLYNCEFRYDALIWDYTYKQFKSDNSESYYIARLFNYNRPRMMHRNIVSDNAYLFYRAFYLEGIDEPRFSSYPLFIMDNKGSYIIFEDKNTFVDAWSTLELYARSNGLYKGIYPQEIEMYKDLIKGFKNTTEVKEFFNKVKDYAKTYNKN